MAEKTIVRVSRKQAKDLFNALGWKNNDNWPNSQFAERMSGIPDVAPEDKNWKPEDEEVARVYLEVMAGIEEKCDFEVYDDEASKAEAAAAKQESAEEKAKKEAAKAAKDEEKAKAKAAKEAAKAEAAAAKEAGKAEKARLKAEKEAAKATSPRASGPKPRRNRFYYAGQVLKEFGLKNGITPEMVEEVDKRLGGTYNTKETKAALGWAWHCVNGVTDELVPQEATAAAV